MTNGYRGRSICGRRGQGDQGKGNCESLIVSWVGREIPFSLLRFRCEKTSHWVQIIADSGHFLAFAFIIHTCTRSEKHKCRRLKIAPRLNVKKALVSALCLHLSSRDPTGVVGLAPFTLQHQVSYWICESDSNLLAKVRVTAEAAEPRRVIRQKVISENFRVCSAGAMAELLGRLRGKQASAAIATQVVILVGMVRSDMRHEPRRKYH
jgi:hypothetical protein